MRHFALVLAALALSGCEAQSTSPLETTLPLVGAETNLESSLSAPPLLQDPIQQAELLERLDMVLSRDDIAPDHRAALREIATLLRETI